MNEIPVGLSAGGDSNWSNNYNIQKAVPKARIQGARIPQSETYLKYAAAVAG